MAFELNPQQMNASKEGIKWFKSGTGKQTFEISGPAGSGKTTIVKTIAEGTGLQVDEILYIAYVGKAAQNLALRGHNARTIHSALYTMEDIPKMDGSGSFIYKNGRIATYKSFIKRESLNPRIKLIVVDEGGMVDINMAMDILSFGLPVVVLGDLNQLPPVFGKPGFLNKPDIILTQIMRQAEDSEIIWLSQQVLEGKKIPYGKYNNSLVIPYSEVVDEHLSGSDMIICGKNKTRDEINSYYRRHILKLNDRVPIHVGEKLVCRKNDWTRSIDDNIYLINGMIGFVDNIHLDTFNGKTIEIDFQPDFLPPGKCYRNLVVDLEYLATPAAETYQGYHFNTKMQHGNAISVHLSQGSQYPSLFYHRDIVGGKKYQRALDYTAITRAEKRIIIAA